MSCTLVELWFYVWFPGSLLLGAFVGSKIPSMLEQVSFSKVKTAHTI